MKLTVKKRRIINRLGTRRTISHTTTNCCYGCCGPIVIPPCLANILIDARSYSTGDSLIGNDLQALYVDYFNSIGRSDIIVDLLPAGSVADPSLDLTNYSLIFIFTGDDILLNNPNFQAPLDHIGISSWLILGGKRLVVLAEDDNSTLQQEDSNDLMSFLDLTLRCDLNTSVSNTDPSCSDITLGQGNPFTEHYLTMPGEVWYNDASCIILGGTPLTSVTLEGNVSTLSIESYEGSEVILSGDYNCIDDLCTANLYANGCFLKRLVPCSDIPCATPIDGTITEPCECIVAHFDGVLVYDQCCANNSNTPFGKTCCLTGENCASIDTSDHSEDMDGCCSADILPFGNYPNTCAAIPAACSKSFDAVVLKSNVRITIWDSPNFTGSILVDMRGPIIMNNKHWENLIGPCCVSVCGGLNCPPSVNFTDFDMESVDLTGALCVSSPTDMYVVTGWSNGSFKLFFDPGDPGILGLGTAKVKNQVSLRHIPTTPMEPVHVSPTITML